MDRFIFISLPDFLKLLNPLLCQLIKSNLQLQSGNKNTKAKCEGNSGWCCVFIIPSETVKNELCMHLLKTHSVKIELL